MSPYLNEGFFSFIITLWHRAFLFVITNLSSNDLVIEDLQFLALIASGFIGLFLGFYLVYNNLTMVANSLSHTILFGLIICYLVVNKFSPGFGIESVPFYVQMMAASLTAVITMISLRYLSKRLSLEASNAFSFTAFFALGLLLSSSLLKNTHLGLESVLGNIEALTFLDIKRLFLVLGIVALFIRIFKTRLTLVSFDSLFAKTIGVNKDNYRYALIFISSLSLMVCFRSLGVILILSLLTSPILIARLFFCNMKKIFLFGFVVVFFQATICLALVQALYIYYNMPVSTSGLFGFLGLVNYLIALIIKRHVTGLKPATSN